MKTPNIRFSIILLAVLALSIPACGKKDQTAPAAGENGPSPAGTMAGSIPDSPVARVNGQEIPKADLDRAILGIVLQNGMDASQAPFFLAQFGPRILDQLVQGELLFQEAGKKGFSASPEEIDAAIAELSGGAPSNEEFKAAMEQRGFTEDTLRKNLQRQMTIRKFIEGVIAPMAVIPEEAVRTAYDQNPENFQIPEEVRASHVLIQVAESDPQEKKDEALERARKVASLARQEGADFAQLAREFSEGPTAPSGGDLGFFRRGRMVKPFENAAFTLEVGKISEPVLTQFGYHVIKVTERREGRSLPFEDVKEKLAADLTNRMIGELVGARIEQLRAGADIEILFKGDSGTSGEPGGGVPSAD